MEVVAWVLWAVGWVSWVDDDHISCGTYTTSTPPINWGAAKIDVDLLSELDAVSNSSSDWEAMTSSSYLEPEPNPNSTSFCELASKLSSSSSY